MDLGTKALSRPKGARRSRCNRWGTQLCIGLPVAVGLTATAAQASATHVVRVHNWAGYIDPGVIHDFERNTGINEPEQTLSLDLNYLNRDSNRLLLPEPTIPTPEKRRRPFFLERLSAPPTECDQYVLITAGRGPVGMKRGPPDIP